MKTLHRWIPGRFSRGRATPGAARLAMLCGLAMATGGHGAAAWAQSQPPQASASANTAGSAHATLGGRLLAGYIRPASQRLSEAGDATERAIAAYCAQPADPALRKALDQRFGELAEAWGRLEFLRFGPLVEGNRFERVFFFPDPRGVVQRQVGAALAAADPALLAPAALAGESVALQGMPALEYALYAGDAEAGIAAGGDAGRYRCDFARAVAQNIVATVAEFAAAWHDDGDYAREFARPDAHGRLYRNGGEVATEALKAVSGGLHYLRDIKLAPALGATPEQARGQRAPLWRSGRSKDLLRGNVGGIQAFLQVADFPPALPEDQRWIPVSLHEEADRILASLETLALPFDRAVVDPEQRATLEYAMLLLKNLQDITDQNLAPALGVNLGFNAFDGD